MDSCLEIVLADDQTVFVDALTTLLAHLGHHVAAAATSRSELLDATRLYRPDVCVLESRLPDGTGVEVVGELLEISPATKVVLLTSDRDPQTMHRALPLGAVGFVHKTRGVSVLLNALTRVMAGEIVIEGSFVRPERPAPTADPDVRRLAAYLTQREVETLSLLVAGLDTVAMARQLRVSTTTVRTHVQAVLTKLGAHSRLEAASLAVRYGLVDLGRQEPPPRRLA
jgi:two-component system nitrate/nitrite response regulator NarL